ncbi:hypothetical protein F4677DRAFT_335347 [Hypoxylon crocopeplum]|nr:hypothetical protein F4677DRAFT_335347 [Hypoxylon crocopeplum]
MPPRYDEAPELAPHNFPEVHHPPSVPEVASWGQPTPATPIKPEESTNASTIHPRYTPLNSSTASPYPYDHQSGYGAVPPVPPSEQGRASKRILGCTVLVFILSLIIAILSAAVIGLAAGTGVEASRANDAEARLAAMSTSGAPPATVTVTAPASTPTIDKGCSTNSAEVTGETYLSQFFNTPTYRIYCNSDAPNDPLSSLFVGNFDDCMDACASYSFYIPSDFSSNSTSNNATCAGVSFIPAWTNRTFAFNGGAPGNCYLKPGPQNQSALNNPSAGTPVHAAILDTS